MNLSQKEIEVLLSSDADNRYKYSIKKIADEERLWALYDDGWTLAEDEAHNVVFPLWPAKAYAEACATGNWDRYKSEFINLEDLMNELLPKLDNDNIKVSLFYLPSDKGSIVEPSKLYEDLKEELEKYL